MSFRRPQGLARLLGALEAQRLPASIRMRVVVVDNDAAGSAAETCRELAARVSYPLIYAQEKRRGIPQARNRALALALREPAIAFLDDDCVPEPGWLAALLRALREHPAQAVTGPCLPEFEDEPPAWIRDGGFFERPRHAQGAPRNTAYTHNVLVATEALEAMQALFDERLALSGGEDSELFRRFTAFGHRIVWADDAVVHETVPASRMRLGWILRRALRVGAVNAWVERQHAPAARTSLRVLGHGLWCLAKGGLQALARLPGSRAAAARGLALASFGVGRLAGLAGWRPREYAQTHGR